MGKENPQELSNFTVLRRRFALTLGHLVLPGELTVEGDGLQKAEQFSQEGYGLVICQNHIAFRDPLQVAGDVVFASKVLRKKKVLAPIGIHQTNSIFQTGVKIFGAELAPVVTEESLKQEKFKNAKRSLAKHNYLNIAIPILKDGGIVLLTPQGTRQPKLAVEPKVHPVTALTNRLLRNQVGNVAFLFVGAGIPGVEDYTKINRGYNIRTKFQVKVGPCYTLEEALNQTEEFETIDHWALAQLNKVVPDPYKAQGAGLESI